jgi:hypothetical protein
MFLIFFGKIIIKWKLQPAAKMPTVNRLYFYYYQTFWGEVEAWRCRLCHRLTFYFLLSIGHKLKYMPSDRSCLCLPAPKWQTDQITYVLLLCLYENFILFLPHSPILQLQKLKLNYIVSTSSNMWI